MTGFTARRRPPAPRGRHAPPLEDRLRAQRRRLLDAGYDFLEASDALAITRMTAEQLSRAAHMSKATFYQHYADIHEFKADLCADLATTAAGGGIHSVQHALARADLLVSTTTAKAIAEHLQALGWTPPERNPE
ncbi:MAG TPA: hypothetical protein VF024_12180 [Solirubrobacteraceae bacterium]